MAKRIGVLTGGGDAPGLNPYIKTIVNRAAELGFETIGIRRGWAGLLQSDVNDSEALGRQTVRLDPALVRKIDRSGGTFLHTSRSNPTKVKKKDIPGFLYEAYEPGDYRETADLTPHMLEVLEALKIDVLVVVGGDDTLGYAHRIHEEGVPVIGIPKTMDNDVFGTDYCIGFSTAVSRCVDYITQLRTSVGSHERIGVVELFGRNSGETSLISAFVAGVDRAIISEVPFDVERLAHLLATDKQKSPSNYALMTISEGARMVGGEVQESGPEDDFGHRKLGGIGHLTAREIKRHTGQDTICQSLGYLMRSGVPDSLDRMVATNFGMLTMRLIQEEKTGRLVVIRDGRYNHEPIDIVQEGVKRVDVDTFYDVEQYRPKVTEVLGKPMFLY